MSKHDPTNQERIERVVPLFNQYSREHGEAGQGETNLVDMFADLFHLAKSMAMDPEAVVRRAMNHWTSEVEEAKEEKTTSEYSLEKKDLRAIFKLNESVDSFDGYQELDEYESSTLLTALADPVYAKALMEAYDAVEDKDIFYEDDE